MASKDEEKVVEEGAEDAEMGDANEEEKQPEPAKELETDAKDQKPVLKAEQYAFLTEDTTMNVMQTVNGKLLMALSDGGLQYLLAGARASVGVKGGRYMYEVMIAEARNMNEPQGKNGPGHGGPKPKQYVRVGLSTSNSSLIMGTPDATENVCFDSNGYFLHGKTRTQVSKKFVHSQVVALLVNLDKSSPNVNTVSLFINGVRASEPQKIPENMQGKALFPTLTYRNVTLQVNFGPSPLRPLPFKCHTLLQASKAHSEVRTSTAPKDGKYEVVLPVGLPDEGTFDWVDQFLEKNRNYTELSDRAILDWANKSGLQRNGGYAKRCCNDKPEMNFGLTLMDDLSVARVLKIVSTILPRNYIIPEVKGNLMVDERKKILNRFPSHSFKKVVNVVVGEPPAAYKKFVQEVMLKEKQDESDAAFKRKKAEAARKKAEEERQKKREEERKKRAEEIKKAREAKQKAAAGEGKEEAAAEDGEEKKEEAEEEKKEEEKVEEKADEPMEEEEAPPKVELTDEEKKLWYRKTKVSDLTVKDLAVNYTKFSLPTKEEGFDAITYTWAKEDKATDYMKKWVGGKKMTQKVEDLYPSEWFKQKWGEWTRLVSVWKRKQSEFRDPARRKQILAAKKRAKEKAEQAEKAATAEEEEKKNEGGEEEAEKKEEGQEEKAEGEGEEKKEAEAAEAPEEKKEPEEAEEPEEMKIDVESLDPFGVEDVSDIGNDGQPLFSEFKWEDWALCCLRFELHILVHAFKHDLNDPERPTFVSDNLPFYYNRYFKKELRLNQFGLKEHSELIALIKDTVELTSSNTLETHLSEDTPLDNFLRLTEDLRRERELRIDLGDETAKLNFQRPQPAQQGNAGGYGHGGGNSGGYGRDNRSAPSGKGAPQGGKGGYGDRRPPPAPSQAGKGYQPPRRDDRGYGQRDDRGYGQRDDRGGKGQRDDRGYGQRDSGGYGQQKRSYPPPPPASTYPPTKTQRTDYGGGKGSYGSGAPSYGGRPSDRGSYGGGGGGSAYSRR
eukprot:TRINITY_DN4258_c0_g1_i1.p1 TRINITY_DN4258_c0_g1~~TRINITY_DN4258_c0_g1_i1.p1  ORF type:complete len:1006 (+),score=337.27 TRINITY_DN4258_c0_g1_i1:69-3086(+)